MFQIFHSHYLLGTRIFHSDTQATLQFWDTVRQATAHSLFAQLTLVDVSVFDLLQSADELVEGIVVDHETGHAIWVVRHDVGRPDVLPAARGEVGSAEVSRDRQRLAEVSRDYRRSP